ncbi:MAG: SDR family oxidoreductase [Syntrophobacteraceae bacterium]
MKTYFITGATGAIGAQLVPLLLRDEDVQVRLLIRARNQEHLDERMRGLLDFWGLKSNQSLYDRIKSYRGDATLPLFGLAPSEYEALAGECTHVVHSAGNVRMNLPLEEARKSSLDSAREIAAFAARCQSAGNLRKVEFVSTVGVGGKMCGVIPEDWISQKRSFHNTYEAAKAEAEAFMHEKVQEGLPVAVHRPSMVVGASETGRIVHFQVFYHLCEFLSGKRTFGMLPRIEKTTLDIIPVDYVATVIAWSSNQPGTIGKVLHECSGPENAIPLEALKSQVQTVFQSRGERIPRPRNMPLPLFQAILPLVSVFATPPVKRAIKALPFFFDYLVEKQSFANSATLAMLGPEMIELPRIGDCLEGILEYYMARKMR